MNLPTFINHLSTSHQPPLMNHTHLFLSMLLIGLISCQPQQSEEQDPPQETLGQKTSIQLVAQEWPGQPATSYDMPIHTGLDKLEYANPEKAGIGTDDLVLGMVFNDQQIAIPLQYMEGFEVANLSVNQENYVVTWCPLVGSARIFDAKIDGDTAGFDFGRALIEDNLLVVDRKTQSVWNQLSNKAIHGELEGKRLNPLPSIQSTWGFWKEKYPETQLLINKDTTGAAFPSTLFDNPKYTTWRPGHGDYKTMTQHKTDNLGLGIEGENVSVYFPFATLFEKSSPIPYQLEEQELTIHFDKTGLTAWAEDQDGKMVPGTLAYDWAWESFYPKSEIFKKTIRREARKETETASHEEISF